MLPLTAGMDLDNIILSKISQMEKNNMSSLICGKQNGKKQMNKRNKLIDTDDRLLEGKDGVGRMERVKETNIW